MKAFDENPDLRDFFNVISVTADRDGVFYVSTMEAKKVWARSVFRSEVAQGLSIQAAVGRACPNSRKVRCFNTGRRLGR